MYNEHFGLREPPFTITPDTSFFFAHASHQDALNVLLVALRTGEGFIKVVGEVGTGKTLLCRRLLSALDPHEFETAYIPNPYLEPRTLLFAVADEIGASYEGEPNQHQLLRILNKALVDAYAEGKRVVLCLDEAQAMPTETLEALRLLSNLETERRKLLQVVLFGQPELDRRLEHPSIRQLKQRITFSCQVSPLKRGDVDYYLAHRLQVAGYRGPPLFTKGALNRLYTASGGVPRLLNILTHKSMLAAYGEGMHYVDARHAKLAAADTESTRGLLTGGARKWARYAAALLAVFAASAGVLLWGHWS